MPRKQFDLIVFDWDGTLMDSTSTIVKCIQASARDLGLPVPGEDAASHVIGLGLYEAMQAVLPNVDPKYYPRMVERYRYHFLSKDHELTLFDGVAEMLHELAASAYFLGVATGKSRVGLNRALAEAGLLSMFDATRCADETFSKPHPAMLQIDAGIGARHEAHPHDRRHQPRHPDGQQRGRGRGRRRIWRASRRPVHACNPMYSAKTVQELHQWLSEHA